MNHTLLSFVPCARQPAAHLYNHTPRAVDLQEIVAHALVASVQLNKIMEAGDSDGGIEDGEAFSDINVLGGSAKELDRLQTRCDQLYSAIVSEEVDEDEFQDFLACLENFEFFDFVKSFFPCLRGETDESVSTDNEYFKAMQGAAEAYQREPYLLPAADNTALQLVRHYVSILSHFVMLATDPTPDIKTDLARSFVGLFEACGKSPQIFHGFQDGMTNIKQMQQFPVTFRSTSRMVAEGQDKVVARGGCINGGLRTKWRRLNRRPLPPRQECTTAARRAIRM